MTHITLRKAVGRSPFIAVISSESATDWINYRSLVARRTLGLPDLEFRKGEHLGNEHQVILRNVRKL